MHCRSVLLLEQELLDLFTNPLWGISIRRASQQPLVCFANISGLRNSLWEKGTFHVTLYFSEHYNEEAPDVVFNTIPFHPNVHPDSGKVGVDFLNNCHQKNQELSLANLLISLQELLSNPVLDDAVNEEAKQLLLSSPRDYEQMVQQCVSESQRLHGAIDESILEKFIPLRSDRDKTRWPIVREQSNNPHSTRPPPPFKPKQVSFDVYHRGWIEAATTKPLSTNQLSDDDEAQAALQVWHPNYPSIRSHSPASSIRVAPHTSIVTSKSDLSRKRKMEKMEALKQLYMNKSDSIPELEAPVSSAADVMKPGRGGSTEEGWDKEADELLAWTNALNTDAMLDM